MTNYVLAFRGRPDRHAAPDADAAWGTWFTRLGDTVVDFGHRVGQVRTVAADGGGQDSNVLTGYVVINAANIDTAAELAGGCPGLAHGVSVEVAEAVDA
ncbi:MAG TPA: hypothetical protein VFU35_01775 [Jatrophihabitans sp.]|nr:hypothetical protein [Jatrophihabitans sp.]